MPTRLSTGTPFSWEGKDYKIHKKLQGGNLNIVDVETGEVSTVAFIEVALAIASGELKVEELNRHRSKQMRNRAWDDIPEHLREIAKYRYEVIKPFIDLPPSCRTKMIKDYVNDRKGKLDFTGRSLESAFSYSSICRWIELFEEHDRAILGLVPNIKRRGNTTKCRIHKEVENILGIVLEDFTGMEVKVGIDRIFREVMSRIRDENHFRPEHDKLPNVSKSTVARRVKEMDQDGKLTLKRSRREYERRGKQFTTLTPPNFPLERVEIDHTMVDIILVDENGKPVDRPTLTLALDVHTRFPLGFYLGFDPPSFDTIRACLIHGILPKVGFRERYNTKNDWLVFGIPETLVVDNGLDFAGQDLQDACMGLGIVLERNPVRTPHYKGAVERFFRTLNTGLIHTLPGTTFSNPVERGDYESEKEAILTLSQLDKLINAYIVDMYAIDINRGIEDSPAHRWKRAFDKGFNPRIDSRENVIINLGRVASATLHHYGIDYKRIRYNHRDLGSLRARLTASSDSTKVKFKINPRNLGSIFVQNPFEKSYIEVPAVNPEYAEGLTLWQHKKLREFFNAHTNFPDPTELGDARRHLDELIEQSEDDQKRRIRRNKERWKEASNSTVLPNGNNLSPNEQIEVSPLIKRDSDQFRRVLDFDFDVLRDRGWDIPESNSGIDGSGDEEE